MHKCTNNLPCWLQVQCLIMPQPKQVYSSIAAVIYNCFKPHSRCHYFQVIVQSIIDIKQSYAAA